MNTFKLKLRQTLPTFITIIISVIILFCLSKWVLITLMGIQIEEIVWQIYIPVLLPWIPCIYFLNRKLRSLGLHISGKSRIVLIAVCILTTGAMLIMLGRYSKESAHSLTHLPNITKIDSVKTGKYFKLDEYFVNRYGGHHIQYTRSANRNSNRLHLNIYMALPLLKNKDDEIRDFPRFWYGFKFSMGTNGGTEAYKRALEQEFLKECIQKINEMTFKDETYFEQLSKPAEKKPYEQAINNIPIPKQPKEYVIMVPYFDSFNHKATVALYWFFGIFVAGIIFFIAELTEPGRKKQRAHTAGS